jgi:membrane protease YdiL (CAAX protease family)
MCSTLSIQARIPAKPENNAQTAVLKIKKMTSHLARKSIIYSLEFFGLYTLIFIIIGICHLTFARLSPEILGKENYQVILANRLLSSLKWVVVCFIVTLLIWLVRNSKDGWKLKDLGYRVHADWGKDIWMGVLLFCLSFMIRLPLTIAVFPGQAELSAGSAFYNSLLTSSFPPVYIFLSFFFMALSTFGAAFWEEVFWRGYLQTLFSRKISPSTGFILTALIFGLGHFFTRPDWGRWGMLMAFGVLLGGFFYGMAYYITEGLIVVAVMHFLSNIWWDYPEMVYLSGNRRGAYMFIVILSFISLGVCILGRRKIKLFWLKTKEIFSSYGWKMIFIGVILGGAGLSYQWGKAWLRILFQKDNPFLLAVILVAFSALTLGLSFTRKNNRNFLKPDLRQTTAPELANRDKNALGKKKKRSH